MKKLLSTLQFLIVLHSFGQLSFYDTDLIYEGSEQNNLYTKYAISYDYNNDGNSDILHFQNNKIFVLLGNESGYNQEELIYTHESNFLNFSNPIDIDSDGRKDFLINTNNDILVFNGTQSGISLTTTLQESDSNIPVISDFDSDGINDIIFSTSFEIKFVKGEGNNTFSTSQSITENISELGSVFRFKIVDIDNDDDLDIFILDLNNSKIHAIYNDDFVFEINKSVDASDPEFGFGDFNLDGIEDLAVINSNRDVEIYLNGESDFQLSHTYSTFNTQSVVALDYNSNGRTDLLISNRQSDLTFLASNGDGTFADAEYIISDIPKFSNTSLVDFNDDEVLDIMASSSEAQNQVIFIPLFPGVGDANSFSHLSLRSDPSSYNSTQLADLDNDGNNDLVIFSESGAIYIHYGEEGGLNSEFSKYESNVHTNGGFLDDVNNDGMTDIVSYYRSPGNGLSGSDLYINTGNREFADDQPFKYVTSPNDIMISDYDKDGIDNLVYSNNNNEIVFLTVDENNYNEYFSGDPLIISTTEFASDFSLIDINNDEWDDLIVGTFQTKEIEVYLNNQNGGFETPSTIILDENEYPTALHVADLNNDQVKEVIVSTTFSDDFIYKLKIFSRSSVDEDFLLDESFEMTGNYGSNEIIVADFDGDTDVDIFTNEFDNLVSNFIINNGDTWETKTSLFDSFNQNLAIPGDINSDGLIDFVRTNMTSGSIVLTINNSVSEPASVTSEIVSITQESESIILTLNDSQSSGRIVLVNEGKNVDAAPEDGIFYSQNSNFGVGSEIGNGNFVVFSGSENSFEIDELNTFTDYHVSIFEYNANEPTNDIINYLESESLDSTFTVMAEQTLSASGIDDYFVSDESFEISITSDSELEVTVTVVSGPITLEDGIATITGDGDVILLAEQAGNKYYFPIEETYEFSINKEDQELTATGIEDYFVSESTFTIQVSASSGLAVDVSVESGPITLDNNIATITGDGPVVIHAIQTGDEFYNPVEATYEFNINKESQTLVFNNQMEVDLEEGTFELDIVASSELPVTLTLLDGPAELNGNIATLLDYGVVSILAVQEGNEEFLAVEEEFEFEVIEILGLSNDPVEVFPNPVTNYLKIKNLSNNSIKNIEIYNAGGAKHSIKMLSPSTLDLSNYKSGTYFLKFQLGNKWTTYRIIKN